MTALSAAAEYAAWLAAPAAAVGFEGREFLRKHRRFSLVGQERDPARPCDHRFETCL